MGIETFTNISTLNEAWPLGTDSKSEGDDHIRGVKKVLRAGNFATGNVTSSGFVGTGTAYLASTGANPVALRPNGLASASGQLTVNQNGTVDLGGTVTSTGGFASYGGYSVTGAAAACSMLNGTFRISNTGTGAVNAQVFYNANGVVGTISTSGTTTAYATSSDERLKDFIGPYDAEAAIEIIRADPVREFTWKADGVRAVGWGAQTSYAISADLASPPPGELLSKQPGDEDFIPWGIDQGKRTPYLWAALAGALDKIGALEARIAALEAVP